MSTTPNSNPTHQSSQQPPRSWIIQGNYNYRDWLNTCPSAQTLLADLPDYRVTLVIPLPCKQWSCRFCAQVKTRQLAAKTRDAKPNRMMTLTVDPKRWASPREAFDGTRRQIAPLFSTLRQRFGPAEYLRVTELTKAGWPHYHFLLRSDFLPHAVVRNTWEQLTGATIVDLRQVKPQWNAYSYLLKYLCKLHSIEWTERHVSYSRGFFPEPPEKPPWPFELRSSTTEHLHPNTYLTTYEVGNPVARVTNSVFAVANELDRLETFINDYSSCREKPAGQNCPAV